VTSVVANPLLCFAALVAARSRPGKDSSVDTPQTKYAKTPDGVYIAYQTVGDGPIDIVWQFDWLGNVDTIWEYRPSGVPDRWHLYRVVT
jgi:hypothetical protein